MTEAKARKAMAAVLWAGLSLIVQAGATESFVRRPMALMVFFDGGRADGLFNVDCPVLTSLRNGAWAEGYNCAWSDAGQNIFDACTLSYPNHSSILCGVTAAKHRVLNNDQVLTKGARHGWPTWAKRLVAARPNLKAHAFYSDGSDALIMPDDAVPMTLAKGDWRACDESTTRAAERAYRGADAPDAGLFFLQDPDCTGHYCGYYPTTDAYRSAYAACDAKLGRVLAAIRARPTFAAEDWMIVFTTDHGGKLLGHGHDDAHYHTVPILVVARHVANGILPGCPRTYDLAPTLLAHFGVDADGLDGRVIGDSATPSVVRPLEKDLFCHETFDSAGPLTIDVPAGTRVTSRWGYADCVLAGLDAPSTCGDRPVSAAYGRIFGRDVSAAFRLEGSAKAFTGTRPSFTLAFWLLDEGEFYADDPIVLGNKNIYSFQNHGFSETAEYPGFAIFLRTKGDDGSYGVTLKYVTGDGVSMKPVGGFMSEKGKWNFYAVSVHPDNRVQFYQGTSDGLLHSIAADCTGALWSSGGPLMVGQDVTGQYAHAADLAYDELRLWTRALTTEEVQQVFCRDRNGKHAIKESDK